MKCYQCNRHVDNPIRESIGKEGVVTFCSERCSDDRADGKMRTVDLLNPAPVDPATYGRRVTFTLRELTEQVRTSTQENEQ